MTAIDYAVLFASVLGIALYGILRTRGRRSLHDYLRGKKQSWFAIGLSVMATQASAITFLSTPGQGYDSGLSFVQNYFAVPLALVIIAAFFLPIYRKLNVYTAYEYLGTRFDKKTRLLAAGLFLIQRGLGAGITIYAPAIVLSTVFAWPLWPTIVGSGLVVIIYTVAGGSDAVTHTQKYQLAIIFAGMITAFIILLSKIPCSLPDALALAGHFGKLNAVNFSPNLHERYTFWSGMLGGLFLMLSYFGTDQSQVQRYISGDNLRESRIGLMFNALLKIPMQFGILFLGVMLFAFYQFNTPPIFFNQSAWHSNVELFRDAHPGAMAPEWDVNFEVHQRNKQAYLKRWVELVNGGDKSAAEEMWGDVKYEHDMSLYERQRAIKYFEGLNQSAGRNFSTNDADYVFITFILDHLPHGVIGLLVAAFFAAALSSKAAELNALASCSTIDFYRYFIHPPSNAGVSPAPPATGPPPPPQDNITDVPSSAPNNSAFRIPHSAFRTDRHYVLASKAFTILWGLLAIAFALFAHMSENLIQAVNIVGSIFYGVVLALFLMAFFIKFIRGTPAFCGALIGQSVVFTFVALNYAGKIDISYLWYNLIGCLATVAAAALLQLLLGPPRPAHGFPVQIP
jgi:solute:Na+ symporter, SSS family